MEKNKSKKEFIIMSILTIAISAGVTTAFAHNGVGLGQNNENQQAMTDAIEAGDYQAWVALQPENGPMNGVITEDNFDQLQAMHEALQSGDRDTADAIRDELGLPDRGPRGDKGERRGSVDHQAMTDAIEAGDYQAWVALQPENGPMNGVITEDNFDQLQAMHEALQSGDRDTADAIRDELGLPDRGPRGGGNQNMNHDCVNQQ